MIDIINKKRCGLELSLEELKTAFIGYLEGRVPDYQMASLLMAICINGMSEEETFILTDLFLNSGERLDFSFISGTKVDKHSTGGVGDKTTLVVVPIVAACGVLTIKMSGRSLGYTGGTIDKLESIPGYRTELSLEEVFKQVEEVGAVMMGQTGELCPLDKMIYALRDVTGTTESIPLIAASIMSKKLASDADKILIDIKVGSGAFMKTEEDALKLSQLMIKIGEKYGHETRTILSNMATPLGKAVGNALEVEEAIAVLKGEEQGDLLKKCIEIASHMVSMGKDISFDDAKKLVEEVLTTKKAYQKFLDIVSSQGGNIENITVSSNIISVVSEDAGVIQKIDALSVAKLVCKLGAGREKKEDLLDPSVGIYLEKKEGEKVSKGDILLRLYLPDHYDEDMLSTYDFSLIFEIV